MAAAADRLVEHRPSGSCPDSRTHPRDLADPGSPGRVGLVDHQHPHCESGQEHRKIGPEVTFDPEASAASTSVRQLRMFGCVQEEG